MKDFNGKLAVVTGGASGVGLAIGEALAKEGAKVILTDIEQESLETSTATLAEQSLNVSCIRKDFALQCRSCDNKARTSKSPHVFSNSLTYSNQNR